MCYSESDDELDVIDSDDLETSVGDGSAFESESDPDSDSDSESAHIPPADTIVELMICSSSILLSFLSIS